MTDNNVRAQQKDERAPIAAITVNSNVSGHINDLRQARS